MIPRLIFVLTLIFVIQSKNFINLNNQLSTSIQKSNSENELANQIIKKYGFSQFIFYDPEKYISDTNSMIDYMKQILNNHQIKVFFFILNEISNPENIDKYLSNVMNELETKIEKYSRLNNLGILILMEQNKYSYYLNSNNLNKKQIIEIINQNLNKKISKSNIESIIKDLLLKINKEIKQQNQILLSVAVLYIVIAVLLFVIICFILICVCMCGTTGDTYVNYNEGYYVPPQQPTQAIGLGVVNRVPVTTHPVNNFQANLKINVGNNNGGYVHTNYVNTNVNTNINANINTNMLNFGNKPYSNDYYYKTGNNDGSYSGGGNFGNNDNSYGGGGNFGNNNGYSGGGNFGNNNNSYGGGGDFNNNNNSGGGNFGGGHSNNSDGGGGNFGGGNNDDNHSDGGDGNFGGGNNNDDHSDGGDGNFGGGNNDDDHSDGGDGNFGGGNNDDDNSDGGEGNYGGGNNDDDQSDGGDGDYGGGNNDDDQSDGGNGDYGGGNSGGGDSDGGDGSFG